ncbi:MAG: hypothetical protein FJ178_07175, partial [Gammaproteobacteria bacterium]|nr:hypothetical protein [Gammaproteobacteria bacterium]
MPPKDPIDVTCPTRKDPPKTTPAKASEGPRVIAENRRARFDYFIEDRHEAGLVLEGWEVKA